MAYVGPQPLRRPSVKGRRPVVATLDTGCGEHPWLDGVVRTDVKLGSQPIGYVDDETDPEKWFDQFGALDGAIDPLAGHGTFIAGLIHQACPDADIVAWRIVGADGLVVESNLVKALEDIAELARRHRDGEAGGHPIDVLSLSLGYYHETPDDELFDPTMYGILRDVSASAASPWSARPGTTPPRDPCSRRRSRRGSTTAAPCMPSRTWCRSCRSGLSTPTARPTRCSATPAPGSAPTPAGPR